MRLKMFLSVLLLVSLFFIGCTDSKPDSNVENKSTPTEKTEVLNGSPTPSGKGFPALTSINGTGTLGTPSDPNKFTFAVFGDNRGGGKITEEIFKEIAGKNPAFAFSLGDIIPGKEVDQTVINGEYQDFLKVVKTIGAPVFNAPGNHEMDDDNDIPNADMHKFYTDKQNIGAPLYGSFGYGNSHFIALNTSDLPPEGTNPPTKPKDCSDDIEFSYISQAQIDQLKSDLAANKNKTHIFIMMHYPINPKSCRDTLNPESIEKLNDAFANNKNISFILASHEHLYYNHNDQENVDTIASYTAGDPPRYMVSGGAGAPIYCSTGKYGFDHYLLFEVDGDKISATINKSKDQRPCKN